jgi:hypothetical protein
LGPLLPVGGGAPPVSFSKALAFSSSSCFFSGVSGIIPGLFGGGGGVGGTGAAVSLSTTEGTPGVIGCSVKPKEDGESAIPHHSQIQSNPSIINTFSTSV